MITNVVGMDKLVALAEAQVEALKAIDARLARLEALQGPATPSVEEQAPKPRSA